jgi:hypothetical protein
MTKEEYAKNLELYAFELDVLRLPDEKPVEVTFYHTLPEAEAAFFSKLGVLRAHGGMHFTLVIADTGEGQVYQYDHVHQDEECSLCARF